MSDEDKRQTLALIRRLSNHHTIIVVEHDMAFVKALECADPDVAPGQSISIRIIR